VTTLRATLAREAQLRSFTLLADTGLIRRQAFVDLAGPGAALVMSGLSLPSGRDHTDTTLTITHAAPHTTSREVFRHMVDDEATGIFQGRIIVPAVAQKTDGAMSSKAILLSPDASMFSKPELEIFADDVTCAHGATCGALDQDLLFYLMARGLPHAQARAMLLEAFAGDALETIADATLRAHIQAHLQARLAGTGVA
jgi:Fe-S cluster assembly protein SufD